jgi:broad specificity phosphatase PhoE
MVTTIGKKKVIFVRHGRSMANEHMDKEGNRWGDSTFTDDLRFSDSKLSDHGRYQAHVLRKNLESIINGLESAGESLLIVVSPLTRALETLDIACHGLRHRWGNITVLAHPLATERVYTASDTGRTVSELMLEFPYIDFESEFRSIAGDRNEWRETKWWFHTDYESLEWRPHGEGQFYAVPGEPEHIFHTRMQKFSDWLGKREERIVIIITHWAVIKWFSGLEIENCAYVTMDF